MGAALDLGQQRARGQNTKPGNTYCKLVQFIAGGRGVFMPLGGMTRFFGASFVWLCTLGRGRGVKMLVCILSGRVVWGVGWQTS